MAEVAAQTPSETTTTYKDAPATAQHGLRTPSPSLAPDEERNRQDSQRLAALAANNQNNNNAATGAASSSVPAGPADVSSNSNAATGAASSPVQSDPNQTQTSKQSHPPRSKKKGRSIFKHDPVGRPAMNIKKGLADGRKNKQMRDAVARIRELEPERYYEILNQKEGASHQQIEKAAFGLMRLINPRVNGNYVQEEYESKAFYKVLKYIKILLIWPF